MKLIALTAAALSVVAVVGTANANEINDDSGVPFPTQSAVTADVAQANLAFLQGGGAADNERGNGSRFLSSDR